ncbi:MAG TPA: hypothetical protein VLL08_22715 [Kineosporiaceae bacterium]|nr:hypothetical protein [Kineosporiaceae bacterium]
MTGPPRTKVRQWLDRHFGDSTWVVAMNLVFCLSLLVAAIWVGALAGRIMATTAVVGFLFTTWLIAEGNRMTERAMAPVREALRTALPPVDQTLLETGSAGVAVVLALTDTGTTISDDPVVHLTVRVSPADGSADFTAEFDRLVSRLEIPRPGDCYPIRYDPEDRSRLLIAGPLGYGPMVGSPHAGEPTIEP